MVPAVHALRVLLAVDLALIALAVPAMIRVPPTVGVGVSRVDSASFGIEEDPRDTVIGVGSGCPPAMSDRTVQLHYLKFPLAISDEGIVVRT